MQQDACTKGVFREMDGFVCLVALIASLGMGDVGTGTVENSDMRPSSRADGEVIIESGTAEPTPTTATFDLPGTPNQPVQVPTLVLSKPPSHSRAHSRAQSQIEIIVPDSEHELEPEQSEPSSGSIVAPPMIEEDRSKSMSTSSDASKESAASAVSVYSSASGLSDASAGTNATQYSIASSASRYSALSAPHDENGALQPVLVELEDATKRKLKFKVELEFLKLAFMVLDEAMNTRGSVDNDDGEENEVYFRVRNFQFYSPNPIFMYLYSSIYTSILFFPFKFSIPYNLTSLKKFADSFSQTNVGYASLKVALETAIQISGQLPPSSKDTEDRSKPLKALETKQARKERKYILKELQKRQTKLKQHILSLLLSLGLSDFDDEILKFFCVDPGLHSSEASSRSSRLNATLISRMSFGTGLDISQFIQKGGEEPQQKVDTNESDLVDDDEDEEDEEDGISLEEQLNEVDEIVKGLLGAYGQGHVSGKTRTTMMPLPLQNKEKNPKLKFQHKHGGSIVHPGAIRLLWELIEQSSTTTKTESKTDLRTRYALYKLFDALFGVHHRNAGVLASIGIVGGVWKRFEGVKEKKRVEEMITEGEIDRGKAKEKERQVLQKLLRKLLEMGASATSEARELFVRAVRRDTRPGSEVNEDGSGVNSDHQEKKFNYKEGLDQDVLEVIRYGMKSRWIEHFSMEQRSAVVLLNPGKQSQQQLPKDGLSFLMWFFPCGLPEEAGISGSGSSPVSSSSTTGSPTTPTPMPSYNLFSASSTGPIPQHQQVLLKLSMRPDGRLCIATNNHADKAKNTVPSKDASYDGTQQELKEVIFSSPASKLRKGRWTHVALVWYQRRGGNPNLSTSTPFKK